MLMLIHAHVAIFKAIMLELPNIKMALKRHVGNAICVQMLVHVHLKAKMLEQPNNKMALKQQASRQVN